MTTQTKPTRPGKTAAESLPARRRFTSDEYERMVRAGIIRDGERVELLDGEVVCMAAMAERHSSRVRFLNTDLNAKLPGRAIVDVQLPLRLLPGWEPQPDIVLLRPRADWYGARHPEPEDVFLVIEVCDSSLRYDRTVKLPRYAAAGIVEVWLVDLNGRRVLVFRVPRNGRYTETLTFRRGEVLTPLALPELQLAVDDVLG
ncbi:MAG: Uma2 family endonuclease [Dehalococcoidia bacterium]